MTGASLSSPQVCRSGVLPLPWGEVRRGPSGGQLANHHDAAPVAVQLLRAFRSTQRGEVRHGGDLCLADLDEPVPPVEGSVPAQTVKGAQGELVVAPSTGFLGRGSNDQNLWMALGGVTRKWRTFPRMI